MKEIIGVIESSHILVEHGERNHLKVWIFKKVCQHYHRCNKHIIISTLRFNVLEKE